MNLIKTVVFSFATIFFITNSYGQNPIKRVIVEESTGTWCASCGYGGVYFEHLKSNYPNAIPVAIHTGPGGQDPMAIFSVELYMSTYFLGSPQFLFDRKDFPHNPSERSAVSASNPWEYGLDTLDSYMDLIYDQDPLATIGITQSYNSSNREISVTVTSNFIKNTTGNFRLNCYILEDSVIGGAEYDQANSNFSGWASGPSYLQYLIDESHPIKNYRHNHVLRAMLGTPEGVTAAIPTTIASGSNYSKTFTYIVPPDFDENNISLVGLVQRFGTDKINDREIVNANSQHLNTGTVSRLELTQNFVDISVYPNPISENFTVEFYVKKTDNIKCDLLNSNGQIIKSIFNKVFVEGEYAIDLEGMNLNNGMYFLKFNNSETSKIKKIFVSN